MKIETSFKAWIPNPIQVEVVADVADDGTVTVTSMSPPLKDLFLKPYQLQHLTHSLEYNVREAALTQIPVLSKVHSHKNLGRCYNMDAVEVEFETEELKNRWLALELKQGRGQDVKVQDLGAVKVKVSWYCDSSD